MEQYPVRGDARRPFPDLIPKGGSSKFGLFEGFNSGRHGRRPAKGSASRNPATTLPPVNGWQMICGRGVDELHEVPLFAIILPCPAERVSVPSVVDGRLLVTRDFRPPRQPSFAPKTFSSVHPTFSFALPTFALPLPTFRDHPADFPRRVLHGGPVQDLPKPVTGRTDAQPELDAEC